MITTYSQMNSRHKAEVEAFPMAFAFSMEQFATAMAKLGLSPEDTDKICTIGSTGGFCLKTDAPALVAMLERHGEEIADAMLDYDFAVDAFNYELTNHEYCVTYEVDDALGALGIKAEDVASSELLTKALQAAIKAQRHYAD